MIDNDITKMGSTMFKLETVDEALLKLGWHVVYMACPNTFGSPDTMERWSQLYDELTRNHGFSARPVLLGMSRGGLYVYNWAAAHPDKVGLIYGDSITLERAEEIVAGLKAKGFASTNVVLGIGSFTYQYNTRDTFGMAMKATYGVIDGKPVDMFKNPKTDSGVKKSAKGLLCVNSDLTLSQQVTPAEEQGGILETVFLNGEVVREESLSTIRSRLLANL